MSRALTIAMQAARKVYPSGQDSEQCHFFRCSLDFWFYAPRTRSGLGVDVGNGTTLEHKCTSAESLTLTS